MLNRSYYRLAELATVSYLSEGDLLDAVERQEFALCTWFDEPTLGLVSKTNALLGLFDYSGTVGLTKQQSKPLLCEGKSIRLERFMILEPERIKAIDDCREQFTSLPNNIFSALRYCSDVPQSPFVASATVCEVADYSALLDIAKKEQPNWSKHENPFHGLGQMFDLVTKPPATRLGIKPIEIKPNQLRFDIRKLAESFGLECIKQPESFGLVNRKSTSPHLPTKPHINRTIRFNQPHIETNPIKLIMAALLDDYPMARSDKLWNILRQDVSQASRRYDVDQVISEMTQDQISWFGRGYDTELNMAYKTFQNQLSAVRKVYQKK